MHSADGGKTARIILYDVPAGCLDSWHHNEWVVSALCKHIGMTQVCQPIICAIPPGLSAGIVIAESHIFVHTWPEESAVRVIIDSCVDFSLPSAVRFLCDAYHTEKEKTLVF